MCVEKYIFASHQYSNREATNRGENELSAGIMHPGKKEYLKSSMSTNGTTQDHTVSF
jgi:hypothetical protein